MKLETGNAIDIEEKALKESEDFWTITGYGSTYDKDLGNDVVVPGAFAKSLRELGMPLLLINHKMDDVPIGTIVECKENQRGLWFKAELPKDDVLVSGRIVPQLKRRGLKGMSMGYQTKQSERRKSDGARLLKEVRLIELSVCTHPMNPMAEIDSVKRMEFTDLPIDRDARDWDAKAAFARLRAKRGDNADDLRAAFLFVDESKSVDEWDLRFLIADAAENSVGLCANHLALFKSSAVVFGGGDVIPEGAEEAVKGNLEAYFSRLNLESPSKSWSVAEFEAQDESEREARLRGLGVSRSLAKMLLKGLRVADRDQTLREAGSPITEHDRVLLAALADVVSAARKR